MPAFPTKRSTKANARHAGTKPRIGQKAFILQCIKEKGNGHEKGRRPLSLLQGMTGKVVFPSDWSGRKSKERLCFLSRPEEDPEQVKTGQGFFFLAFYSSVMPYRIKALGLILGLA